MTTINQERELNWDDQIEKESDFIVLPEGDYDFTIEKFERARHNGSEKLPPCNKAIVHIIIHSPKHGDVTLQHNVFLHTKTEGMISAFFTGIGQKKKGQPLQMNWNTVPGSKGKCKVKIRKWTSKNGDAMESNEIAKFYEPQPQASGFQQVPVPNFQQQSQQFNQPPQQQPQPQQGGYTPGAF